VIRSAPPTIDELLALYAAGPDVMCGLVQDLFARLYDLEDRLVASDSRSVVLQQKVDELTARLNKDSHNSSKPPSSDVFKKPPKPPNLRGKSGKKSGGQPGHAGCTLEPVAKPDHFAVHAPETCASCGLSLDGAEVIDRDIHQVFDIPEPRLEVTAHQVLTCVCPQCKSLNRGQFPEFASQPTQYGPRFLGLLVYLHQYQLIPMARTQECFGDLFGHKPSEGTIATAVAKCAKQLTPVEKTIKGAIVKSEVVNFDETGMRVVKLLKWIHTASTASLTFYHSHSKRGRQAFTEAGILKEFRGTAVHDCLVSYIDNSLVCKHGLCNVHLLRELIAIWEDSHQTWTQRMSSLLRSLKRAKEKAQAAGQSELDAKLLQRYRRDYDRIVTRGLLKNPAPERTGKRGHPANGKVRSLLLRFEKHAEAVLRFATDFAVPFDNNLAERDLRMVKLRQKISGCFRSDNGAEDFCTIRGYISTLRKQCINVMDGLNSVFEGTPVQPSFEPA